MFSNGAAKDFSIENPVNIFSDHAYSCLPGINNATMGTKVTLNSVFIKFFI